jgi:hypothetical protein
VSPDDAELVNESHSCGVPTLCGIASVTQVITVASGTGKLHHEVHEQGL